jgi:hypothetical protein
MKSRAKNVSRKVATDSIEKKSKICRNKREKKKPDAKYPFNSARVSMSKNLSVESSPSRSFSM